MGRMMIIPGASASNGPLESRRNWGARIRAYSSQGMRLIFLENEVLRLGINADRGSEIFELCYKPRDLDFVLVFRDGIRAPAAVPVLPNPELAFIDLYAGGWQEVFPNGGAPSTYQGVRFGQHDEVWRLAWDYLVVEDDPDLVTVTFSVAAQHVPIRIHKEVRLRARIPRVEVTETIVNLSSAAVEAMWGHHLVYGPPFLQEGCRITLPPGVEAIAHTDAIDPGGRRVVVGRHPWPVLPAPGGGTVDLSRVPVRGTESDIVYLTGFPEGWYELAGPYDRLGIRVEWDAAIMPYVWFWQEFGASQVYPWYGSLYTVGLEPFSSFPTNGLGEAATNGTAMKIEPRGTRGFHMALEVCGV
jgi:hypothetical protein